MKKKKQLNRLLGFRERVCDQAKQSLVTEQSRLSLEQQRLEQLENYRQTYNWGRDQQLSGLALNSAQMMVERVDYAVNHQRQQVALQTSQLNQARQTYQHEKRQVRTTELLCDKHQKVVDKKMQKQEQNLADEFAARLYRKR